MKISLGMLALAAFMAGSRGLAAAKPGEYQTLTLGELGAFPYDTPDAYSMPFDQWVNSGKKEKKKAVKPVIPDAIKRLDGTKISISGFMMPFDVEENGVLTFSLVKNIMICCYGLAPKVNETIMCNMPKGQHAKFFYNVPIKVSGTLAVGEVKEDGYVLALYRLSVDKIEKDEKPDPSLLQGPRPIPGSNVAVPLSGPPKLRPRPTAANSEP